MGTAAHAVLLMISELLVLLLLLSDGCLMVRVLLDWCHGCRGHVLRVDDDGLLHWLFTLGGAVAPSLTTQSILIYIDFTADFLSHAILATAA